MPIVSSDCFLSLTTRERWEQIYLALGGESECFLEAPFLEQQRLILALLGSEECIYSSQDFWRAWAAVLGIECVGDEQDAQRRIYGHYYTEGVEGLVDPSCFEGMGPDEALRLIFIATQAEVDPPPTEFDPSDYGVVELWLRPETLTGYEEEDVVDVWPDSSGNGNDLEQATFSRMPLYIPAVIGGNPALLFDGVDDMMEDAGVANDQPVTVYLVAQFVAGASYSIPFDSAAAAPGFTYFGRTELGAYDIYAGNSVIGGMATTQSCLFEITFDGALSSLYVNGASVLSGNAGSGSLQGARLGSAGNNTSHFAGYISEVIVIDLPAEEIRSHLLEKYALS